MRKELMPSARQDRPRTDVQWDITPQALERWNREVVAAATDEEATLSILDPIGEDFWTGEGVTAKRVAGILRTVGANRDIVVNVNSPGGDLFEGMAIYNLLREHKGRVTVKVVGLAASAASIVAMAGDDIQIARAGFLMIHNTWVAVVGNKNDLVEVAEQLEVFDISMAEIYAARTGLELKAIQKKMDAETWINGSAAVDEGWADSLLPSDAVKRDKARAEMPPAYMLNVALAKAGMPRGQRRSLLQDFKSSAMPSADGRGRMPSATDDDTPSAVPQLLEAFKSFSIPT
jgi:ATP-dependent Clp protease protease subunit